MQHDDEIKICPGHAEEPTPLIFTFKFPGAELWCPFCGHTTGFPFGETKTVKIPDTDLLARQEYYKAKTAEFLGDRTGEIKWQLGIKYEPKNPEE